ncbi:MAG: N-acetylmuramoyl-L-alanine amidase-like domain-containing protein [Blastocatellia bacterium]|jgi:hypothetical protein
MPILALLFLHYFIAGGGPVALPQVTAYPVADPFVRQLIAEISGIEPVSQRVEQVSERLLGRRYLTHPLIGSDTIPERLVTRVDGFDCVTFVETVLAIAYSGKPDDFTSQLRAIRYHDSRVEWASRLHYATAWSSNNVARGLLDDLTTGPDALTREKLLDRLPGLDPRLSVYRYYPKRSFSAIAPNLLSGDIILFVSGTPGLDVNHMGIIIRRNGMLLLRSASRRHRAVVDEPLEDYVRRNGMAGFIINRPVVLSSWAMGRAKIE